MKKKFLLIILMLIFAASGAWAQTAYVNALGSSGGWYSDDTRDAYGTNLVGTTLTHFGKPGQTPTAADDILIAQQISFTVGPEGVSALKMDKTSNSGGNSKSTMSNVNESGFASGDNWLNSFFCNYRYYTNSTAEVTIPKIGIQSTDWAASQLGFTALRSGESTWDLILVDWRGTDPGWVVGNWATFNTDKNTVCWRIYRQGGNAFFPVTPSISMSLQQIYDDAYWGPKIFGSGAKVISFQFGVGSSAQTSTSYIDYVETNLLNSGNRIEFDAFPAPITTIQTPTYVSCGTYDVPITVKDFSNIGNASLKLNYDTLVFAYQSATINPIFTSVMLYGDSSGQFSFSYSGTGITLPEDVVLFTLHFSLLPAVPGPTNLTWSAVSGECEYSAPSGDPTYASTFNDLAWTIPVRPVKNTTTNLEYCTIQAAIDATATVNGQTITVAAGTYAEDIIVNKSLTILGPNAAVDPCIGSRVAEAIVVPATAAISSGEIFHIAASNVTISGFTINGDNPLLASGFTSTNGADIDAAEGITVYETGINNLTVTNNVLKNLSYFGVTLYDYPAGVPSSGHIISNNKFEDFGTYDAGSGIASWGGGVLLYNNQYTAVTNNCMTNVRIGIQTGNFSQANPGAPASQVISGNTIEARKRGIFHNLFYGSASPYTISNNSISGIANTNETTFWDAILLCSMSTASTASGNIIDGSGVIAIPTTGIPVWNCQTAPFISGGTISGVGLGINVNNFESYPSTGSNAGNTSATIDGVSITGATIAGVKVHDNPLNTNGATVSVVIQNNTKVSGISGSAFLVEGAGASLSFSGAAPQATVTGTPKYIELRTNGIDVPAGNIDATHVIFNGLDGSGMNIPTLFATEDKIDHKIDLATLGFVTVKALNDYVTPNSFVAPNTKPLIQRGVDAASAAWTVNIADGLYKESDINLDKALYILGQSRSGVILGPSVTDGHLDAAFTSASQGFIVKSSGVNIQKMTIDGNANTDLAGTLHFRNGVITDQGDNYSNITANDITFKNLYRRGVCIYTKDGHASGMIINNNSFNNIGKGLAFESGAAVMVFDADASIATNTIANCGNGIGTNFLTAASNAGLFSINGNSISVDATQGVGLDISGMKGGSTVSGNTITQGQYGIVPEYYVDASITPVTISTNTISGVQYGIYLYALDDVLKVLDNSITAPASYLGSRGIYFSNTFAGETPGAISKAQMEENTINGYEIGVDLGLNGTGTLQANTINGNGTGVSVSGGADLSSCDNNFITNNTTAGVKIESTAGSIGAITNNDLSGNPVGNTINNAATLISATCNWYGTSDYNLIWPKIVGNVTFVPYLVTSNLVAPDCLGEVPPVKNVTKNYYFNEIQSAINDVITTDLDVIEVSAGSYSENVNITKDVTLNGANSGIACYNSRGAESIISGSSGAAVTIASDGVILNGFEITNPSGNNAVVATGRNNLDVVYNKIHDIGTLPVLSGNTHAVAIVMSSAANIANVNISDNCFSNIKGGENTSLSGNDAKANNGSAGAIGVGWSNANYDITGLKIENNTITNVNACTKDWGEGGKGAYGIIVNVGASGSANGKAISPIIHCNSISDLEGLWAHGVGLEGETPGAMVMNNDIFNLTDHKSPSDAVGVQVEDNAGALTVGIHNNSFTSMGFGVQNVSADVVDAIGNWYVTTVDKKTGSVNIIPWLTSGVDSDPSTPCFIPDVPYVPCAIELTETHVDVSCPLVATGSINLAVSGGVEPYTYSWTGPGGFTSSVEDPSGLFAGIYTVIVTADNGCTQTLSVTIGLSDQAAPVITPSSGNSTVECLSSATQPTPPAGYDHCGTAIIPVLTSTVDDPGSLSCEGTRTYTFTYTDYQPKSTTWIYTYTIDHTTPPVVPAAGASTVACVSLAVPPLSSLPDQQQNLFNNWVFNYNNSVGQSFTCGKSGKLLKIDVNVYSYTGTPTFTLKVFEGDSITGTELCSVPGYTVTGTGWITLNIPIGNAPTLVDGSQYTFWLTGYDYNTLWSGQNNSNPYLGGQAWDSPPLTNYTGDDMMFRTYMGQVVTDVCGVVIPTPAPVESGNYNDCEGTKVFTYNYTDCSGLSTPWVYTYTISPPAVSFVAVSDITVDCGAATTHSLNYSNGLLDACAVNGSVTSTLSTIPGACGGDVTETWSVVICGNTITTSRIIHVSPAATPAFPAQEAITVACGGAETHELTYDNGLTGNCQLTGTVTSSLSAIPGACGGDVTETWTATVCGNTITTSRIIHINPAALPTMTAPSDITITCTDLIPVASTLSYSNGLSGGCEISGTSNSSTFFTTVAGSCNGNVTETWTATDACGRPLASVSRIITINDNIPPQITCPSEVVDVHMNNGCTATGIELGTPATSDNCGVASVKAYVGVTEITPSTYAFGLGTTTVTWVVTDNCGLTASCDQTVTVVTNTLSGTLKYNNSAHTPMNNVALQLSDGSTTWNYTTLADGSYQFPDLCAGNYTITANITKPVGGINSTDAGAANYWSTHFVGIEHVKFLAGDVNNDNFVSSIDAQKIQMYFVFHVGFARAPWSFWKAGDIVPSNTPAPPTSFSVNVTGNVANYDLYAMCTGDFNGSFTPSAAKSSSSSMVLTSEGTMVVSENQEFELPVRVASAMDVSAVSMILDIPSEMVEVQDVVVNGSADPVTWTVNGNELRIGWNSTLPVAIPADGSLLTLKLKTTNAFTIGNSILLNLVADPLNELADGNYNVIENAVLVVNQVDNGMLGIPALTGTNLLSLSNYPNPFNGSTTVTYEIPYDGKVTLEVHTMLGQKVISLVDKTQSAGKYTLKADGSSLQPGFYSVILRLKTNDGVMVRTIKFIVNQ